jgi:hypothetical protein
VYKIVRNIAITIKNKNQFNPYILYELKLKLIYKTFPKNETEFIKNKNINITIVVAILNIILFFNIILISLSF